MLIHHFLYCAIWTKGKYYQIVKLMNKKGMAYLE
jgi:hypothetical protein